MYGWRWAQKTSRQIAMTHTPMNLKRSMTCGRLESYYYDIVFLHALFLKYGTEFNYCTTGRSAAGARTTVLMSACFENN